MPTIPQVFALALQHHQAGRLAEAETLYRRILAAEPNHADVWHRLGILAHQVDRLDLAANLMRRALALDPQDATAHSNLGAVLAAQGRPAEAIAEYRQAIGLQPAQAEFHNNLGNALRDLGQREEAVTAFHETLRLKPEYAEAHNNLANVLKEQGRLDESIAAYRRALELKPGYEPGWSNLGNALKNRDQLDEAIAAYRRALALQPASPWAHSNLICALHFHPNQDLAALTEAHRNWNARIGAPLREFHRAQTNDRDPDRALRIGYVSPDFRFHPAAFFLVSLFEAHDRERHEIHCYSTTPQPDEITARLCAPASTWRDVRGLSDADLAEQIRADGIDILVDLAMHTAGQRLPAFARKPAPIQISWLAYPGTTGVEAIDYRLTDERIDPADSGACTSGGEPLRLPHSWVCYAPIKDFPDVSPLPAAHRGAITFGSLNQFNKINAPTLHRWAHLLTAAPDSRLLMICPQGQAREEATRVFEEHGIAASRLEFVASGSWAEYLQLFSQIDIALDAFPCNGMTTTCHALWMGVPTVTLAGRTAVSRTGASLLHTAGLPEWIAYDEDEFLQTATTWAADLPRLADLRATLRGRMQASPLMDAPRFARDVEAAFRTIWHRWCGALPLSTPNIQHPTFNIQ